MQEVFVSTQISACTVIIFIASQRLGKKGMKQTGTGDSYLSSHLNWQKNAEEHSQIWLHP